MTAPLAAMPSGSGPSPTWSPIRCICPRPIGTGCGGPLCSMTSASSRCTPTLLNKVGALTAPEWEVLRRHPLDGARITAPLAAWLGPWANTIAEHHERFDGRGYPFGRRGREISLGGRIVAVTDSYDVMTSARSYKRPTTPEKARQELAACAGSQFDPDVVKAFLAVSIWKLRMAAPLSWLGSLPLGRAWTNVGRFAGATGHAVVAGVVASVGVVGLGVAGPLAASFAAGRRPRAGRRPVGRAASEPLHRRRAAVRPPRRAAAPRPRRGRRPGRHRTLRQRRPRRGPTPRPAAGRPPPPLPGTAPPRPRPPPAVVVAAVAEVAAAGVVDLDRRRPRRQPLHRSPRRWRSSTVPVATPAAPSRATRSSSPTPWLRHRLRFVRRGRRAPILTSSAPTS